MPEVVNFGKRLLAAAEFVRPGAVFADIGTDHASLPIYLAQKGIITRAYACDIATSPIELAAANIKSAGLEHVISTVQTNGFNGLDVLGITDAAVCGMGAELTVELLSSEGSAFLRRDRVRLIFQPMSRASFLRGYLVENGFAIIDEKIVRDAGRQYELICAEYTGENCVLSPLQLQLGKNNMERGGTELAVLAKRRILHLTNYAKGLSRSEKEKTDILISQLKEISEKYNERN